LDIFLIFFTSEQTMKSYFFERLKEASTWRGIVLLLTAIGVPLAPGVADMIISAGLAVAGLIGAIAPDK
jgi:hypothetical protein